MTNPMRLRRPARSYLALLLAPLWIATSCDDGVSHGDPPALAQNGGDRATHTEDSRPNQVTPEALRDAPLHAFQGELLELAYDGVSRFPLEPHIKNRSRAQERVVQAAFALDQPERALRYVEGIANWRRGSGYAEYALRLAERGHGAAAEPWLRRADEVARTDPDVKDQEWRRDTIRSKIAQAYVLLDNRERAETYAAGVVDMVWGLTGVAQAKILRPEQLPAQLELIEQTVATRNFDRVRNMLAVLVELYDRFQDDPATRARLLALSASAKPAVAAQIMIEHNLALADVAIEHGDRATALQLVEAAEGVLEGQPWLPEHQVPLMGQITARRALAGDETVARRKLQAAELLFAEARERIVDIDRAGALRPVAEAWQRLGDRERALALYSQVVEEGTHNPNSRPRADDLADTCCSMARVAFEPDERLFARLREIRDGLVDPW